MADLTGVFRVDWRNAGGGVPYGFVRTCGLCVPKASLCKGASFEMRNVRGADKRASPAADEVFYCGLHWLAVNSRFSTSSVSLCSTASPQGEARIKFVPPFKGPSSRRGRL